MPLSRVVTHVEANLMFLAGQFWLLFQLTLKLLWSLGLTSHWILQFLRLLLFVGALLPAFLRVVYFYVFSDRVKKNIRYGDKPRNLLDIYTCQPMKTNDTDTISDTSGESDQRNADQGNGRPVVIFLSGGAWIIGYKAWGALMGRSLSSHGIIFVTPDYRNFPQGGVKEMLQDSSQAVAWTLENIHLFGGDPNRVFLAGQSAGAHLAAMTILEQARKELTLSRLSVSKQPSESKILDNAIDNNTDQSVIAGTSISLLDPLSARIGDSSSYADPEIIDEHQHILSNDCDLMAIEMETLISSSSSSSLLSSSCNGIEEEDKSVYKSSWSCGQISGVICISGPYNLVLMADHIEKRGLSKGIISRIMGGDEGIIRYSPVHVLSTPLSKGGGGLGGEYNDETRERDHSSEFDQSEMQCEARNTGAIVDISQSNMNGDMKMYSTHQTTAVTDSTVTGTPTTTTAPKAPRFSPPFSSSFSPRSVSPIATLLPPVALFHGADDITCPIQCSDEFASVMRENGCLVQSLMYSGSHTDPILENPMEGGKDQLINDILACVYGHGRLGQGFSPKTRRKHYEQLSKDDTSQLQPNPSTNSSSSSVSSSSSLLNTDISGSMTQTSSKSESSLNSEMNNSREDHQSALFLQGLKGGEPVHVHSTHQISTSDDAHYETSDLVLDAGQNLDDGTSVCFRCISKGSSEQLCPCGVCKKENVVGNCVSFGLDYCICGHCTGVLEHQAPRLASSLAIRFARFINPF